MKRDFVYLASASPRRRELLSQIGIEFVVRPAAIDEERRHGESVTAYVERLARSKADAVWAGVAAAEPAPVLAADTAVVVDGELLGKPRDAADALGMLAAISGRSHTVLTSVAVRYGELSQSLLSTSEVRFRATTEAERRAYCRTGEPLDKAGGYGIQGRAAVFIERLVGSYSGVMGLPLSETAALLARFGLPCWLQLAQDES